MELTTFIYLWKSLVVRHGFRLNIHYLFIYLFKAMSTKTGGTEHLYLIMEITSCDTWFSFEYSLSIYLLKAMSTKAGGTELFLFMQIASCYG